MRKSPLGWSRTALERKPQITVFGLCTLDSLYILGHTEPVVHFLAYLARLVLSHQEYLQSTLILSSPVVALARP